MKTPNSKVTADHLREVLDYDPETGAFRWKVACRGPKPKDGLAGYVIKQGLAKGRRRISIDGVAYFNYRLAFLYVTGEWPAQEIDHIDGNPSNDRWANLRAATHAENMQNRRKAHSHNSTGVLGVHADGKRFKAGISIEGKWTGLGSYTTKEEAYSVYLAAKRQHHTACTL